MAGPIEVHDLTRDNLADLRLCVPSTRRDDPAFVQGLEHQRRWAETMLERWGSYGKIAYRRGEPAGIIQFLPLPAHRAVRIGCLFVPERGHWRQGIASRLLESLMHDLREPHRWFQGQPARLIVAHAFSGEKAAQFPAWAFYLRRGFRPAVVEEASNMFYYPLARDVDRRTAQEAARACLEPFGEGGTGAYVPQPEDAGRALIITGPSFCPFSYSFWRKAEDAIRAAAPDLPVTWIDGLEDPAESARRGDFLGCVVNRRPIRAFVLDTERFREEVRSALL